jgi:hypothetical protein
VGALDVRTRLRHFAIVTYAVDPAALRPHVHSRFDLDTVLDRDGRRCALISVVPFQDVDFAFLKCPWPRWSFGQTNYRAYVIDSVTGTKPGSSHSHIRWMAITFAAMRDWGRIVSRTLGSSQR